MVLSRSRTLYWVLCLGLGVLSLRSYPTAERLLDFALLPTRLLGELCAPLAWLEGRRVRAAEPVPEDVTRRERRAHEALEQGVLASALPRTAPRPSGTRALHAEVVARAASDVDRIRVRVSASGEFQRGWPVVSGDYFVGFVSDVPAANDPDAARGELEVLLVTDGRARIGARVTTPEGRAVDLVVGGLAPRIDAIFLDVHHPSDRSVDAGEVVVFELPWLAEGDAALANGYRLGRLERTVVAGKSVLGVEPGLDYQAGLYQVLVLAPAHADVAPAESASPLDDDGWRAARAVPFAALSPWREGYKLALGRLHGVEHGAAVVSGARLVGRVARAGQSTADVSGIGDPGFAVAALAWLESETPRSHVLGLLRGRGRAQDGAVLFEWEATLPLPIEDGAPGDVPASIWTGSGEVGVPRGFLIGTTRLPRGPGPHLLRVAPPEGTPDAPRVRLRRSTEGDS